MERGHHEESLFCKQFLLEKGQIPNATRTSSLPRTSFDASSLQHLPDERSIVLRLFQNPSGRMFVLRLMQHVLYGGDGLLNLHVMFKLILFYSPDQGNLMVLPQAKLYSIFICVFKKCNVKRDFLIKNSCLQLWYKYPGFTDQFYITLLLLDTNPAPRLCAAALKIHPMMTCAINQIS